MFEHKHAALLVLVGLTACATAEPRPEPTASEEPSEGAQAAAPPVDWRPWTPETFAEAEAEGHLLLVNVGTTWCHWCHVMDDKTWADPAVRRLLAEHFVAVRVDADARPDVAERYERWAWPATAVLTPDARPVVEIKGFRSADKLLALLEGITDDHRAGREVARRQAPAPAAPADADLAATRDLVEQQLDRYWDEEQAGWGGPKKYPLLAPVQHAFYRAARRGEDTWRARALRTLEQQKKITDPVWGGMYQYSTHDDWDHPHYEKLAFMQGWTMRMYAEGYRATGDEALLAVAEDTARYVTTLLRDESGAFYANQDADVGTRGDGPHVLGAEFYAFDDEERRARGMPYIDRHLYAEHNGYLIAGLASLAAVSGDERWLGFAAAAAAQIGETHRLQDGFLHRAGDDTGRLYLSDQVAMAEGLLALYEATGELKWREEATRTVSFVREHLRDEETGAFFAHTLTGEEVGVFAERRRPFELGARAARLMLRLSAASDLDKAEGWREEALVALRWLARPDYLKTQGRAVGDYLLALEDALHEPVHIAVVAPDEQARSRLYSAALKVHAPSRIVERLRPGGRFPDMGEPAAFICGESSCSRPLFEPDELAKAAEPFIELSR